MKVCSGSGNKVHANGALLLMLEPFWVQWHWR